MQPTALKNFYTQIVFLLVTLFFFLLNSSISYAHPAPVAKTGQQAGTVCGEKNKLPQPGANIMVEKEEKGMVSSDIAESADVSLSSTYYVIVIPPINYTPQRISDLIKECPV